MKKVLLLVLSTILLTGCDTDFLSPSNSSKRKTKSSSSGISESAVRYKIGSLSSEEVEEIVLRAVEMEKNYMSSVVMVDDNGEITSGIQITAYKNGYRLYESVSQSGDETVTTKIVSYCPANYSHVYWTRYDEENGDLSISDYITDSFNDQYIYAYGYGQIGANPAALVACQSSIGMKERTFQSRDATCEKTNDHYIVSFKANRMDDFEFSWKMTINSFGGLELLQMGIQGNEVSAGGYKTIFGEREEASQKIINLFKDYQN